MGGAKLGVKINGVWEYKWITQVISADRLYIESPFSETPFDVPPSDWGIFGITISR